MTPMNRPFRPLALAAAAVALALSPAVFGQQQGQNAAQVAGSPEVRQEDGPTLDVKADSPARMVVLFPENAQSRDLQGMQLVLIEMEMPQPEQGQEDAQNRRPQSGEATPTGREIVFQPGQAVDGLVAYKLDTGRADRQYMIVARGISGREVQIDGARGGNQGVNVMTVKLPPTDEQMQQYQQQQQQYREQQQQQQQADESGQGRAQALAGGNSQEPQQPQPTDVAVLMVYAPTTAGR